jgi:hypothetical protein
MEEASLYGEMEDWEIDGLGDGGLEMGWIGKGAITTITNT